MYYQYWGPEKGGGEGGGGGSWLQQMDKQCRVVAEVPHLQVRPVFSRHRDTRWAVDGQEQSAEKKYTAEITHRVNT